ncbi:MAG: hypothetical protein LDL53_07195 [Candidatus Hydrogenedens sp.]|nr:hypothetical protein [Candidatus Hydrogenedens sp.]
MLSQSKETFLKKHKRFFVIISVLYITGACIGIYLFHSPNLSKEYLSKYSEEHFKYREIIKDTDYFKFRQRPHLYIGTPEKQNLFNYAIHYENKPDYQSEIRRINYYLLWFKSLNTITLISIFIRLGWSPLLRYIDKYQRNILNQRNDLEKMLQSSTSELKEAEEIYRTLENYKKEKEQQKENIIKTKLQEIERQNQLAKEQIEFLLETKKKEEVLNYVNNIKRLLIEESIRKIEMELSETETSERLAQTISKFNFLINMLS